MTLLTITLSAYEYEVDVSTHDDFCEGSFDTAPSNYSTFTVHSITQIDEDGCRNKIDESHPDWEKVMGRVEREVN